VLAELGRGTNADLDRERKWFSLLGRLADVELGLANRSDPRRVDRVHVPRAERAAQRLVQHRFASQAADHDRRRHLALAKARDPHLPAERAGGLLDLPLDLGCGDLRLDAHARLGQLGDIGAYFGHEANDTVGSVASRIASRLLTGPLGHFVAGVIDVTALFGRLLTARVTG